MERSNYKPPVASAASKIRNFNEPPVASAASKIRNFNELRHWFETHDGRRADDKGQELFNKINENVKHNTKINGFVKYFNRPQDIAFSYLDDREIGWCNYYAIGIAGNYAKICQMIDAKDLAGVIQALRNFYIANSMCGFHHINADYFDKVILPQIGELVKKFVEELVN